jgi:large subunit ribosomal protein L21
MYAIVTIAGQQFKVEKGKKVIVHQLQSEVGDDVTFEKVLVIDNDGNVKVGTPYVKDAAVTAQVLSHLRGDKIKVFRKKRRKGYQVLNGHRQYFTELMIEEISETGVIKRAPKPKKAEEAQPETQVKAEPEVTPLPKAAKPATKKTAGPKVAKAKTAEPKDKPAVKKPSVKEAVSKAKPAAKKTTTKSKAAPKKAADTKKKK